MTITIFLIIRILFLFLILLLLPWILCVKTGKEKNRNGFLWGFLGWFGLYIMASAPPFDKKNVSINQNVRKCFRCGECVLASGKHACPLEKAP